MKLVKSVSGLTWHIPRIVVGVVGVVGNILSFGSVSHHDLV